MISWSLEVVELASSFPDLKVTHIRKKNVGGIGRENNANCVSHMKVDHSLNEIEFESSGHLTTILAGLNQLRLKGYLTDVTLKTENQTFHAHRVVLAACSDYFRAMFTDPMRERSQTDILLAGVSATGVKYLLDYIYTSKLALSLANIQDVLSAASHLQVLQVIEACSNYLQAQLDIDNCVDVVTIAETYSLHKLRTKVYKFMSENLSAFSSSQAEFNRLSAIQLEHLLDSDFPVDVSEEQVLEILLNWLDLQDSSRMAHAHKLLKKVNFEGIHPAHLMAVIDRKKFKSNLPNSFLSRVTTIAENSTGNDLHTTTYLLNSRGMEEAVVKVGGFGPHGVTNQITYYLPSTGKWRHLSSVPHVECCNFGTAVLRNELFVVGGCFNQSLQENIHPFGFRFSPRHNKWSTMAPMHRERCRFSLTVFGKSLFSIGGCSEQLDEGNGNNLDGMLVERYDLESDTWSMLNSHSLHHKRSQHSAVRHQNAILVSGGLDHDHNLVLNSMLVYYPINDVWESSIRSMPIPRADHVMVSWMDKIFVCGGWCEDEETDARILVDTIDEYDFALDTWRIETRIPTPRYHSGITIVKDKLFVIGGFHDDNLFDKATGMIECYDFSTKTWSEEKSYPNEVWEHTCLSLYIPRCRDDMDVISYSQN